VASTITQYSDLINISYPVPGVDNDSQGFRDNFSNIRSALTRADQEITSLQTFADQLTGNTTATFELVSLRKITLGTNQFTTATTGTIFATRVEANSKYGNLALVPDRVTTTVDPSIPTDSPDNVTATAFGVTSAAGIKTGARVIFNNTWTQYTVQSVVTATRVITVSPAFAVGIGTGEVTFTNPRFDDQPNVLRLLPGADVNPATGSTNNLKGDTFVNSTTFQIAFADYGNAPSSQLTTTATSWLSISKTTQATTNKSTEFATTEFVHNILPYGTIIMWHGTVATVPTGWALCNGSNGTPDLRNKFVIPADRDGPNAQSVQVAKSSIEGGSGQQTGGLADAIVPAHSHTASLTAPTATSVVTDPGHNHTGPTYQYLLKPPYPGSLTGTDTSGSGTEQAVGPGDGGPMITTVTNITVATSLSGGSVTVASAGVAVTNANIPPYYALCYIMKTTGA
jgi:hypothetical protein